MIIDRPRCPVVSAVRPPPGDLNPQLGPGRPTLVVPGALSLNPLTPVTLLALVLTHGEVISRRGVFNRAPCVCAVEEVI